MTIRMDYYADLRERYFDLMRRAVRIGALFSNSSDLDEVSILLAEFNKVTNEINKLSGLINNLPDNPTSALLR
jgi:hypothetical protein